MKVNVIYSNLTSQDRVAKRDDLGKAIGALALTVNDPVYFHRLKDDTLGGAPNILLESSPAFLDMVRKLPGFSETHEVWPGTATERFPELQKYFTGNNGSPNKPKSVKQPKP